MKSQTWPSSLNRAAFLRSVGGTQPLVTAVHEIWHRSGKGRGNPKIYGAFSFICNPSCWGNKQSPSQYRAREILAPIWTVCPDGVRWWTEIVVKVAPNTKTATPNSAVELEQLHFVTKHMDIPCLLTRTAPEPNGYWLFEESKTSPTMFQSWASWSFGLICNCLVAVSQCFFICQNWWTSEFRSKSDLNYQIQWMRVFKSI